MAKEGQISLTWSINKYDPTTGVPIIAERAGETATFDVSGSGGPYVGTVAATTGGTFVSFGAVGTPGFCRFINQDPTNEAYVCFYDTHSGNLIPFARLKPGVPLGIYLPPNFREWAGGVPGTGSVGSDQLWIKGIGGTVNVQVKAFPE